MNLGALAWRRTSNILNAHCYYFEGLNVILNCDLRRSAEAGTWTTLEGAGVNMYDSIDLRPLSLLVEAHDEYVVSAAKILRRLKASYHGKSIARSR